LRSIESVVDIQAPPTAVWQNIERVPPIPTGELQPSWSHAIGFPNPVEATLSEEGVGGVRHATFEGGVLFIETIDRWEPERRLGFSIQAQTERIPKTTLDEHVTVGGRFFDVLYGEYILEPLPKWGTRLHLVSRHRVSTDFNWYAHLWTDGGSSEQNPACREASLGAFVKAYPKVLAMIAQMGTRPKFKHYSDG
jgi:hypothetical protein